MTNPVISAALDVLAGRAPEVDPADAGEVAGLLASRGLAGLAVAEARARGAAGLDAGLPEQVVTALRPAYHAAALETTLVLESGRRAREALAAAGIRTLAFKGAALMEAGVYADPGARAMEDVDLLVPPDAAGRAVEVLGRAGFEPWSPWDGRRAEWLSSATFTDTDAPGAFRPSLDLHWATPYARLLQAGPWPPDPLWDGASGHLPAPEPHFALIAEHLLKHLRVVTHLRGLADLVRLAPRLRDGDLLARQASRRGSLPGLRSVMALLTSRLGVALDPAVARRVGVPRALGGRAGRLLDPARLVGGMDGSVTRLDGILGAWTLLGTTGGSAREVARVLAPSGRWLRARYPDTGVAARRVRYLAALVAWSLGLGVSPLSPNQDVE